MSLFKKKQIYVSVRATKAWNGTLDHTVKIVTFIYERKLGKFHFFRVEQLISLIENSFYDVEYSPNESVKADAIKEKAKAYEYIYNRKTETNFCNIIRDEEK